MKIGTNIRPAAAGAKPSAELSRSEQDSIMRLVNEEKKAGKKPPMAMKYMVVKPKPEKPPMAMKYMVVKPKPDKPVAAKYLVVKPHDDGPIVAKYMVVPGPIVAKYMVVPPWAGVDAHQAVINKATKDGKVSIAEATTLAKLFQRDITHASKDGKDIHTQVAKFLKSALADVHMSDKAHDVIFGVGGPGFEPTHGPYYIIAPQKGGGGKTTTNGPIYIIAPPTKPGTHDGPIYILPPTKPGNGPIYILPPKPKK